MCASAVIFVQRDILMLICETKSKLIWPSVVSIFNHTFPSLFPIPTLITYLSLSSPSFLLLILSTSPSGLSLLSSLILYLSLDYGWKEKCQGCSWQLLPDRLWCTPTRYAHTQTHRHTHFSFSLSLLLLWFPLERIGFISLVLSPLPWFLVSHYSSNVRQENPSPYLKSCICILKMTLSPQEQLWTFVNRKDSSIWFNCTQIMLTPEQLLAPHSLSFILSVLILFTFSHFTKSQCLFTSVPSNYGKKE